MPIGNYITDKIKQGGFSQLELAYDPALKSFIEQTSNEQKISWGDGFGNDGILWDGEDAAIYHEGETDLFPDDMKEIIKRLFGESSEFKLDTAHYAKVNKERAIPGMSPNIRRSVGNDGIVRFYPNFPEYEYIYNQILDPSSRVYQSLIDKVLLPYVDLLQVNGIDSRKGLPYEVPQNIRQGMVEVFEEANAEKPIGDMDKDAMINYTMYNILKLADYIEMGNVLADVSGAQRFNQIYGDGQLTRSQRREVVRKSFDDVIATYDNPMKKLECILNGISAQLYMNTLDEKDMSHVGITDKVKNAYRLYTMHERGDKTFQTDEYGYRYVNVDLGKRDILLHRKGDNISRAMDNLATEISTIMGAADRISEEDYLKNVARLHFRYVMIHPFRDSNGRIGRNIINMMLCQVGRNFVMPKEMKKDYISAMEKMRQGVFGEMGQSEYLQALSDDPKRLAPCEAKYCGELAQIIEQSNSLPRRRAVEINDNCAPEKVPPKADIEF